MNFLTSTSFTNIGAAEGKDILITCIVKGFHHHQIAHCPTTLCLYFAISSAEFVMPNLPSNTQLILASSSPYRRELLSRLHLDFHCHSPQIDETARTEELPRNYVQRLAQEKASKVAQQYPQAWVIGSDQCAVLNHTILGKPGNLDRAKAQLLACSGQEVLFLTAHCLLVPQRAPDVALDVTTVRFRSISEVEIERYLAQEDVLNCAGSFKVEAMGVALFDAVDSTDPTALIGLPLIGLCRQLREAGAQVP